MPRGRRYPTETPLCHAVAPILLLGDVFKTPWRHRKLWGLRYSRGRTPSHPLGTQTALGTPLSHGVTPILPFGGDLKTPWGPHCPTETPLSHRLTSLPYSTLWVRFEDPLGTPSSHEVTPTQTPITPQPWSPHPTVAMPPRGHGALTKNEVIGSEDLPEGSRAHRVHGAGLQVHQDGSWHIFTAWGRDGAAPSPHSTTPPPQGTHTPNPLPVRNPHPQPHPTLKDPHSVPVTTPPQGSHSPKSPHPKETTSQPSPLPAPHTPKSNSHTPKSTPHTPDPFPTTPLNSTNRTPEALCPEGPVPPNPPPSLKNLTL